MSQLFWYWLWRAPARPVRALARQRPAVMVNPGLMLEARTMSALSPVARMDRPSRVPINTLIRMAAPRANTARTVSLYQLPSTGWSRSLARSKMVTALFIFTLLENPPLESRTITQRLLVYTIVLQIMQVYKITYYNLDR